MPLAALCWGRRNNLLGVCCVTASDMYSRGQRKRKQDACDEKRRKEKKKIEGEEGGRKGTNLILKRGAREGGERGEGGGAGGGGVGRVY